MISGQLYFCFQRDDYLYKLLKCSSLLFLMGGKSPGSKYCIFNTYEMNKWWFFWYFYLVLYQMWYLNTSLVSLKFYFSLFKQEKMAHILKTSLVTTMWCLFLHLFPYSTGIIIKRFKDLKWCLCRFLYTFPSS